ncbi:MULTISPECIES: hypothetical protein [Streptomyces]|uniref:hypothetical protein n=1 Tax=Streptomyces TaxID=1883 RepID=UPI0010F49CA6|nr:MULTISPECIES: hypothetical protein [Streptomyces]MYS95920.1 hypothetical protein [Streptomyces sp. SID5469]
MSVVEFTTTGTTVLARTGRVAEGAVAGACDLQQEIADDACDEGGDQRTEEGVGDGGLRGNAGDGTRAVRRDGGNDQPPSLFSATAGWRHLNSRFVGLV